MVSLIGLFIVRHPFSFSTLHSAPCAASTCRSHVLPLLCIQAHGLATTSRLLFKILVSFAEYFLFYMAFLQRRPIISRSLLIVATPEQNANPPDMQRSAAGLELINNNNQKKQQSGAAVHGVKFSAGVFLTEWVSFSFWRPSFFGFCFRCCCWLVLILSHLCGACMHGMTSNAVVFLVEWLSS